MSNTKVRNNAQPQKGQTVLVRHRSKQNKGGLASIESVTRRDAHVTTITGVYMDGRVRVSSGDVWSVKPHNGKEDWVTDEVEMG